MNIKDLSKKLNYRSEKQIRSKLRRINVRIRRFSTIPTEKRKENLKHLYEFCPNGNIKGTNEEKLIPMMDLVNGREICIPLKILKDIFSLSKEPHKKITINENLCRHLLQKNRIENFYASVIEKQVK
jgi:hypothetical protein